MNALYTDGVCLFTIVGKIPFLQVDQCYHIETGLWMNRKPKMSMSQKLEPKFAPIVPINSPGFYWVKKGRLFGKAKTTYLIHVKGESPFLKIVYALNYDLGCIDTNFEPPVSGCLETFLTKGMA